MHSALFALIDEVQWLLVVAFLKRHTKKIFPALAYRNYRLFIVGHGISLTGSWMHRMAQGYLVYELTGSALWVGIIDAIGTLPILLFSLFAGVILDHFPKRNVVRITQAVQCLSGITLGFFVITDNASLLALGLLAFINGCASSIDLPARFSLPMDLVGKKDLHAAYALNMSTVHAARILGPAIGGFLIAGIGVGWVFLINGLTFLAPFISFTLISFPPFVQRVHENVIGAIKDGVSYALGHSELRLLLLYTAIFGIFGWSYTTMLPVFASDVYAMGPSGLGLLFSVAGAGTVLGGFVMSGISRLGFNPHRLILFGSILYSVSLFFFTLHPWFTLALGLLFFVGFGQAFQNSTVHTRVQMLCSDTMRGRVSSIQSVMLQGMQPIGSIQVGLVASFFGPQIAVAIGALTMFASGILLYKKFPVKSAQRTFERIEKPIV